MQLEFGYGNGVQTVELPQENLLGVLHAAPSSMNAGGRMRSRGRWTPPSGNTASPPPSSPCLGGSTLPYLQDAGPDHSRT